MLKHLYLALTFVVFIFSNACLVSAASAFDDSKITEAEKREAEEIAMQFTLRFARDKDIALLIKDYYRTDFIEGYKKEVSKIDEAEEENLEIIPYLSIQSRLFKKSDSENLQKLYVASHNYFLSYELAGLEDFENDKNAKPDVIISPKFKELFNKNPILSNLVDYKWQDESKPISSPEEMRNSIDTLNEGTRIFNEDNKPPVTETALRRSCEAFFNRGFSETKATVIDEELFGIPKGTRIIAVETPLSFAFALVRENNKLKIFFTAFPTE